VFRRIFLLFFFGLIVLTGFILAWPRTDPLKMIPAESDLVLFAHDPPGLAVKIADSDLGETLRESQPLRQVFEMLDRIRADNATRSFIALLKPTVHGSASFEGMTGDSASRGTVWYVDFGRPARLVRALGFEKALVKNAQMQRVMGHTVFSSKTVSALFIGTVLVVGSESGVTETIKAYEGKSRSFADTGKMDTVKNAMDPSADFSIVFTKLDRAFGAVGKSKFNPSKLFDAKAAKFAVTDFFLRPYRVDATTTVVHKEGGLFSPYTDDRKPADLLDRIGSEGYSLAAFVNLEDPSEMTEMVAESFGRRNAGSKLSGAIQKLFLGYLLQSVGPQIGWISPAGHAEDYAIVLQVKNRAMLEKSLAKAGGESMGPSKIEAFDRPLDFRVVEDVLVLSGNADILDTITVALNSREHNKLSTDIRSGIDPEGSLIATFDLLGWATDRDLIANGRLLEALKPFDWRGGLSITGAGSETKIKTTLLFAGGFRAFKLEAPAGARFAYTLLTILCVLAFLGAVWGLIVTARNPRG
jgi:hypothetical protein